MWKGIENCARKWCLFLCTILFQVSWAFWKMWCSLTLNCDLWRFNQNDIHEYTYPIHDMLWSLRVCQAPVEVPLHKFKIWAWQSTTFYLKLKNEMLRSKLWFVLWYGRKNYRVSVSSGYFKFDGMSSVFHPYLFSLHVILDEVKGPELLSLLRVGLAQNYGGLVYWLRTGTCSIPWTNCWRYKEKVYAVIMKVATVVSYLIESASFRWKWSFLLPYSL